MKYAYLFIAILLGLDTVFIHFKVGGLSIERLLEFFFFFFFFKKYIAELASNPFFKKWNQFILAFAILQLSINVKLAITGELDFKTIYTDLIKCFSFVAFSFLFLLIAKKDIKYINTIVFLQVAICLFGILQHPISPLAPQFTEFKNFLFSRVQSDVFLSKINTEEAYISGGYSNRFRLSGPFASAIRFSYFAFSSFIIAFYLEIKYKKIFYKIALLVIFIASILTQTRSLLLAELIVFVGYLFFLPSKKVFLYRLVLVFGAVFLFVAINLKTGNNGSVGGGLRVTKISSSGQKDSRPFLWITGINTIVQNPFGVTESDYQQVKWEEYSKYGLRDVLFLSAHNGLINLGFRYSIIGYLIFFYLIRFLNFNLSILEPKVMIFFRLSFLGYIIHTSFHNNFIFNSDYTILLVAMLIYIDRFSYIDHKSSHNTNTFLSNNSSNY